MGEGKGQDGALFPSECVCRSERRTGQARREEKSGTGLSSGYGQAACSVPLAPSASRRQQRIWLEPLEPLSTGAQQGCPGAMKLVQDDPAAAAQSRAHVRTSSHSSPAASGGLVRAPSRFARCVNTRAIRGSRSRRRLVLVTGVSRPPDTVRRLRPRWRCCGGKRGCFPTTLTTAHPPRRRRRRSRCCLSPVSHHCRADHVMAVTDQWASFQHCWSTRPVVTRFSSRASTSESSAG